MKERRHNKWRRHITHGGAVALLIFGAGVVLWPKAHDAVENKAPIVKASVHARAAAEIVVKPEKIVQGEPIQISVLGVESTTTVRQMTFNGKDVGVFMFAGAPTAVAGADLYLPSGIYTAKAVLADGEVVTKKVTVATRFKRVEDLGIPEKLGGNTKESQQALAVTLTDESLVLKTLKSSPKVLWSGPFIYPVANPVITDPYGYARQTGAYTIPHLGTDFKAKVGTPIVAMNDGIVKLRRTFRNFGNTVVVDHGEGLMTLYLHLSQFSVAEGQAIKRGQLLGYSGETGYVSGPHLHLSVKVNSSSLDPMKFMALFGTSEARATTTQSLPPLQPDRRAQSAQ